MSCLNLSFLFLFVLCGVRNGHGFDFKTWCVSRNIRRSEPTVCVYMFNKCSIFLPKLKAEDNGVCELQVVSRKNHAQNGLFSGHFTERLESELKNYILKLVNDEFQNQFEKRKSFLRNEIIKYIRLNLNKSDLSTIRERNRNKTCLKQVYLMKLFKTNRKLFGRENGKIKVEESNHVYEDLIDRQVNMSVNYTEPIADKMVIKEKKLFNKTRKFGKRLNKLEMNSISKHFYFMEILNFKQVNNTKNGKNISNMDLGTRNKSKKRFDFQDFVKKNTSDFGVCKCLKNYFTVFIKKPVKASNKSRNRSPKKLFIDILKFYQSKTHLNSIKSASVSSNQTFLQDINHFFWSRIRPVCPLRKNRKSTVVRKTIGKARGFMDKTIGNKSISFWKYVKMMIGVRPICRTKGNNTKIGETTTLSKNKTSFMDKTIGNKSISFRKYAKMVIGIRPICKLPSNNTKKGKTTTLSKNMTRFMDKTIKNKSISFRKYVKMMTGIRPICRKIKDNTKIGNLTVLRKNITSFMDKKIGNKSISFRKYVKMVIGIRPICQLRRNHIGVRKSIVVREAVEKAWGFMDKTTKMTKSISFVKYVKLITSNLPVCQIRRSNSNIGETNTLSKNMTAFMDKTIGNKSISFWKYVKMMIGVRPICRKIEDNTKIGNSTVLRKNITSFMDKTIGNKSISFRKYVKIVRWKDSQCKIGIRKTIVGNKSQEIKEKIVPVLNKINETKTEAKNEIKKDKPPPPIKCSGNFQSDCYDYYRQGYLKNMVLSIRPKLKPDCNPSRVYCDMKSGGYTIIQRRMSGQVSFYRNWTEYKQGFGDPAKEYWLGLDNIHYLTNQVNNSLRIELEDWNGRKKVANYDSFTVGSEADGYVLHLKGFTGDAGDSLGAHDGMKFSTYDVDNDLATPQFWGGNCAKRFHGAWWYKACYRSNLNGKYYPIDNNTDLVKRKDGVSWNSWLGNRYSLKSVTIMIRRNFKKN